MNCVPSVPAGGAQQLSALLGDPCERAPGNAEDPGNAADRQTLKHHGRRQVQGHPADRVSHRDPLVRLRITVPSGLVAATTFAMRPGLPTSVYYDDSPRPASHLSAVVCMSSGEKG